MTHGGEGWRAALGPGGENSTPLIAPHDNSWPRGRGTIPPKPSCVGLAQSPQWTSIVRCGGPGGSRSRVGSVPVVSGSAARFLGAGANARSAALAANYPFPEASAVGGPRVGCSAVVAFVAGGLRPWRTLRGPGARPACRRPTGIEVGRMTDVRLAGWLARSAYSSGDLGRSGGVIRPPDPGRMGVSDLRLFPTAPVD